MSKKLNLRNRQFELVSEADSIGNLCEQLRVLDPSLLKDNPVLVLSMGGSHFEIYSSGLVFERAPKRLPSTVLGTCRGLEALG